MDIEKKRYSQESDEARQARDARFALWFLSAAAFTLLSLVAIAVAVDSIEYNKLSTEQKVERLQRSLKTDCLSMLRGEWVMVCMDDKRKMRASLDSLRQTLSITSPLRIRD